MSYRKIVVVMLALCLSWVTACSSGPSAANNQDLSYEQIKGSGLANLCPQVEESQRDAISILPNQTYTVKDLCLQPTAFWVKQEPLVKRQNPGQDAKFLPTKPLTRSSFSIGQVSGTLQANSEGRLTFVEQSGFDFQPITVQLPDGERVPLLFSVKGLVAQTIEDTKSINLATQFSGNFQVPAYRTANFLDPKGRGLALGYDAAMGLPIRADSEDFQRSNTKIFEVLPGSITLQVNKVDQQTGEIAGFFESIQPSDTEFGAKEPLEVKIQGVFYARLETETA